MTALARRVKPGILIARAKLAIRNREDLIYHAAWEVGQMADNIIGTRSLLILVAEYLIGNIDKYGHLEVVETERDRFVVRTRKDAA